ncbi:MAG: DUF5687 family protein [Cloacibacterium normanense]
MFLKFLQLELKSFVRSPQFAAGILMKIGMLFMYAYLALIFVGGAIGVYFGAKKVGYEPIQLFSRIFLVYIAIDLLLKYFMQQLPAENIKPFLTMKISKNQVAGYTLVKILVSFFSWAFTFCDSICSAFNFKGNLNAVTMCFISQRVFAGFYQYVCQHHYQ